MNAKDYLKRAKYVNLNIKRLMSDLDYWRDVANKLSSSALDVRRNPNTPTEAIFVKPVENILELENNISTQLTEALRVRQEVTETIELLDSSEERLILTSRYINNKSWYEIGVELHMSQRSVFRKHREALQRITSLLENKL